MQVAGILGGLGPETTANFYSRVNTHVEESGAHQRPPMLIWNVAIEYATEQKLLTEGVGLEDYVPFLVDGIRRLEAGGADFLVVPCNTVHDLYDEMSRETGLEMLHIVGETTSELRSRDVKSIALFATGATIKSRLYQGFMEAQGIRCTVPDEETQHQINATVAELVQGGQTDDRKEWFGELLQDHLKAAGAVVLGCTDLHILVDSTDENVVDSMDVLATSTAHRILA